MNTDKLKRVGWLHGSLVLRLSFAVGLCAALIAAPAFADETTIQSVRQRFQTASLLDLNVDITAFSETGSTNVNDQLMPRATFALQRVAAHGLAAVPSLIDAAEHTNGLVRLRALQTLYIVGERHRRLVDLMPLFVRATHDVLPDVRLAGVTAIGGTCAPLRTENMTNELQTAFGELSTATRDSDNDVRLTAALYLLKFGQDRLIPEDVRQQVRDKKIGPDSL